jgi:hypothetical protein
MHGGADEAGRPDRAQGRHRQRFVGALHAIGAGGQRHVGAVVHEEAGATPASRLPKAEGEGEEIADLQVLLAELKPPEPGLQAGLHHLGERAARLLTIGDEIEGEAGSAAQLVLQSGTPSMGDDAVA